LLKSETKALTTISHCLSRILPSREELVRIPLALSIHPKAFRFRFVREVGFEGWSGGSNGGGMEDGEQVERECSYRAQLDVSVAKDARLIHSTILVVLGVVRKESERLRLSET
jgi:hypothetical protein